MTDQKTDNWAGRGEGMRCRTCRFYVDKVSAQSVKSVGRCRRHAPSMQGFPVVYFDDWCGDHKLNENAL